ncbi:hypothetical protein GCM10025734_83190 [Kitasatospora paranensis]
MAFSADEEELAVHAGRCHGYRGGINSLGILVPDHFVSGRHCVRGRRAPMMTIIDMGVGAVLHALGLNELTESVYRILLAEPDWGSSGSPPTCTCRRHRCGRRSTSCWN